MTTELVMGLVALVVALVGGGYGWQQIKSHGAEIERRKEAEGDAHAAEKRAERAETPPASKREARRILRDRLERLRRRMCD